MAWTSGQVSCLSQNQSIEKLQTAPGYCWSTELNSSAMVPVSPATVASTTTIFALGAMACTLSMSSVVSPAASGTSSENEVGCWMSIGGRPVALMNPSRSACGDGAHSKNTTVWPDPS